MKHTISTLEVRQQLGDILNRVALRHDEYIIERKGRPLAAVVPVDKLTQLESAARSHILELMHRQKGALTNSEAMSLADEAKHRTRREGRSAKKK